MSKVARALKLYIRAAASPFVVAFGLFMMLGMAMTFILDPEAVGSEDYITMLSSVQMGNIGTAVMAFLANGRLQQNKFYSSCTCARELFTIGPVAAVTVLCLMYDTMVSAAAYINLGTQGLADTIVFNTISSMLIIIVGGCWGKNGVPAASLVQTAAYLAFLAFPFASRLSPVMNDLTGLPLGTAAAFAVCGYIIAVAVTLWIGNIWWKKGDRFAVPNRAMQTALEMQAYE